MIPVYDAISFEKKLDGGASIPWLVNVLQGHQIVPYVVKIYKAKQFHYNPKVNEVICSLLAEQMGLDVPKFAFVKMDSDFIKDLDAEFQEQVRGKDWKLNFATSLLNGCQKFEDIVAKSWLNRFDTDSIFAFDFLVCNADRWNKKPNILFKDGKSYLIDHEKTLYLDEKTADRIISGSFRFDFRKHIFIDYLKSSHSSRKAHFFEKFFEYLGNVDFDSIEDKVERCKLESENVDVVFYYLRQMQKNEGKFMDILRKVIE